MFSTTVFWLLSLAGANSPFSNFEYNMRVKRCIVHVCCCSHFPLFLHEYVCVWLLVSSCFCGSAAFFRVHVLLFFFSIASDKAAMGLWMVCCCFSSPPALLQFHVVSVFCGGREILKFRIRNGKLACVFRSFSIRSHIAKTWWNSNKSNWYIAKKIKYFPVLLPIGKIVYHSSCIKVLFFFTFRWLLLLVVL